MGIFEESTGIVRQILGEIPVAPDPVRVFLSYAREDDGLRAALLTHLTPLVREQVISVWYDARLHPGSPWNPQIGTELARADILVLLVSSDSLASTYIRENELRPALLRREAALQERRPDALRIVPVILRPCDWQRERDIAQFQALPAGGSPVVTDGGSPDPGLTEVARELHRLARELRGRDDDPS